MASLDARHMRGKGNAHYIIENIRNIMKNSDYEETIKHYDLYYFMPLTTFTFNK